MAAKIRAIETVYDGYRFRSRLEARWAVFFNALGIKYEYEKEGYDLGEYKIVDGLPDGEPAPRLGWYLPDFWLPAQKYWIEIKGPFPTTEERVRMGLLAHITGHAGFVQFGSIPYPHPDAENSDAAFAAIGDWNYWWCECPYCGTLGLEFSGMADRLRCKCAKVNEFYGYDSPRILAAYIAARHARFEHGETPK